MDRAGDAALRSEDGAVREPPLVEPGVECAADPGPPGRGVDAGIGRRQSGGLPLQVENKSALQPLRPVSAWPQRRALPSPWVLLKLSVQWSERAKVRPRRKSYACGWSFTRSEIASVISS